MESSNWKKMSEKELNKKYLRKTSQRSNKMKTYRINSQYSTTTKSENGGMIKQDNFFMIEEGIKTKKEAIELCKIYRETFGCYISIEIVDSAETEFRKNLAECIAEIKSNRKSA